MPEVSQEDFEYRRTAGRLRKLGNRGKEVVSHLKKNSTNAEIKLWELVRRKKILGLTFRRQHKIGKFIVDFFCIPCRLAVEVDGSFHLYREDEDAARTAWLSNFGIKVLRFSNDEVFRRPEYVIEKIKKSAQEYLATSSPLPSLTLSEVEGQGRGRSPNSSPLGER